MAECIMAECGARGWKPHTSLKSENSSDFHFRPAGETRQAIALASQSASPIGE